MSNFTFSSNSMEIEASPAPDRELLAPGECSNGRDLRGRRSCRLPFCGLISQETALKDVPTSNQPYLDFYRLLSIQCSSLHKTSRRQLTAGSLLSFLITTSAILWNSFVKKYTSMSHQMVGPISLDSGSSLSVGNVSAYTRGDLVHTPVRGFIFEPFMTV